MTRRPLGRVAGFLAFGLCSVLAVCGCSVPGSTGTAKPPVIARTAAGDAHARRLLMTLTDLDALYRAGERSGPHGAVDCADLSGLKVV